VAGVPIEKHLRLNDYAVAPHSSSELVTPVLPDGRLAEIEAVAKRVVNAAPA
jgi:hypothetical protein